MAYILLLRREITLGWCGAVEGPWGDSKRTERCALHAKVWWTASHTRNTMVGATHPISNVLYSQGLPSATYKVEDHWA